MYDGLIDGLQTVYNYEHKRCYHNSYNVIINSFKFYAENNCLLKFGDLIRE